MDDDKLVKIKTGESEQKSIIGLQLVIDFAKLREISNKGVSRAAAFLSVGLSVTENYVPASLALAQDSMWRFFPEPVPEQLGKEAGSRRELGGNCRWR